ncbi:MAG: PAS domain-containing protein, partial [Planctomycetota bacterium]|nr:PAS domain-containing protein [Planctomycetota bacterium]
MAPAGDGGPAAVPELADLGEIIQAYSAAAAELQQSHELLQRQVQQLTGELQKKNRELSETVLQVSSLKNHLAGVIQSSADGIAAIGLDRRITAWNPAANILLDISGGPTENPEGKFILDVMRGPCRDFALMLMRSIQEDRSFSGVEMRITDQKGRVRHFSASASPVRNQEDGGGGRIVGAVQVFSDLTEIRGLEARANRQDRLAALGEMAAGVAHEIRNPLGGIELYASSLRRKFPESSSEYATCGKIIGAAASLNRIVSDMLTFTRNRPPKFRKAQPSQVLRSALDMAARELEARGVEARLDIPKPERARMLDPDQLARAALNIILNAAQAMERGGVISIGLADAPERQGFSICFADQGPGIPDEIKPKIFDPFFTLRQDGTGLGLAIVHRIVQDHGGVI